MGHGKKQDFRRECIGDICGRSFSSKQILEDIGPRLKNPFGADKTTVAISGLSTGFNELDKLIDGLHPGELIIVAQRPCMGAERFVRQIMLHVAENAQVPAVYFSTEKSRAFILREMVANTAQIFPHYYQHHSYLTEQDLQAIASAAERLAEAPIIINDNSANPRDIREHVETLCQSGNRPGLIVVDKIPRSIETSSKAGRVLGNMSYELFRIARDNQIPVIALASVSRKLEYRKDKEPRLAEIVSADGILWYADTVITLYKEAFYEPYTSRQNQTRFNVAKSFYGDGGWFELLQDGHSGQFVAVK